MLKILVCLLLFHAGILVAQHNYTIKIQPSTYLKATEGDSKFALCEASDSNDVIDIEWISPKNEVIGTDPNRPMHIEEGGRNLLRLFFTNLTEEHSGTYTCKATFKGVTDTNRFDLKVSRKYEFENDQKIHYTMLGQTVTLQCRLKRNDLKFNSMSWTFNNVDIRPNEKGSPFVTFEGDKKLLFVKNVTNETLGNYSCISMVPETGEVFQRDMEIRLKRAPKFEIVYKENTVFVPITEPPYPVQLVCKVTADPPANIEWFRYDTKVEPREHDVSLEERDNEKILKLNVTGKQDLGSYVCAASNDMGSSNMTLFMNEGEKPRPPSVHKREEFESGFRLDIHQQKPEQNLTNFRVLYRKKSDIFEKWQQHDFKIKDSETLPYAINNLTSNTEYVYKVGACTQVDLCEFSGEETFKTTESNTSSACILIQSLLMQFFVLLPLFFSKLPSLLH